jgi:hypothetical protein
MYTRSHSSVTDEPDGYDVQVTESVSRFSPAQILHAAIGVFLLVIGIIAIARGGLDGELTTPTFDVLGMTHNAAIGIGEVVAGALLLLAAAGWFGRVLGIIVGLAMIVVGAVLLGDDEVLQDLQTEEAVAWLAIALGGAAVLGGLIPGRRVYRRDVDRRPVNVH